LHTIPLTNIIEICKLRELDEKALSAMSKNSQATCYIFCGLFAIEFFSEKAVGLAAQHYC
jgi:hypothetical protein